MNVWHCVCVEAKAAQRALQRQTELDQTGGIGQHVHAATELKRQSSALTKRQCGSMVYQCQTISLQLLATYIQTASGCKTSRQGATGDCFQFRLTFYCERGTKGTPFPTPNPLITPPHPHTHAHTRCENGFDWKFRRDFKLVPGQRSGCWSHITSAPQRSYFWGGRLTIECFCITGRRVCCVCLHWLEVRRKQSK